jgi:hypothetical protein
MSKNRATTAPTTSPPPLAEAARIDGATLCLGCRFGYKSLADDAPAGLSMRCHRYPPQIVPGAGVAFPPVHPSWTCGEGRPR